MDDRSILDQLRTELAELRAENRELRARVDRLDPPAAPAPGRSTRRGALAMAAGAAGGALAASLGAAAPASAADGGAILMGEGNAADAPTGIEVTGTTADYGFGVTDNGATLPEELGAPAVFGHARNDSFFVGVLAYVDSDAPNSTAFVAQNDTTGDGVAVCEWSGKGYPPLNQT